MSENSDEFPIEKAADVAPGGVRHEPPNFWVFFAVAGGMVGLFLILAVILLIISLKG